MSLVASVLLTSPGQAQVPATEPAAQTSPDHQHDSPPPRWTINVDGALFATFNRQGGSRGHSDWRSQNWLMASAVRSLGPGRLIVSTMLTLEPVTVGAGGYAHLLQVGEAYNGLMNTDRQHPHELFTQLAIGWSQPIKHDHADRDRRPSRRGHAGTAAVHASRVSLGESHGSAVSSHPRFHPHCRIRGRRAHRSRPFSIEGSTFHGREPDESSLRRRKRHGPTRGPRVSGFGRARAGRCKRPTAFSSSRSGWSREISGAPAHRRPGTRRGGRASPP